MLQAIHHTTQPESGIRKNARQFVLLVIVNAFVGAMIGLERSVLADLGVQIFHLQLGIVLTSFVLAFGLVKAITNLAVAKLLKRLTRKQLLLLGWLFALPVPFLLSFAESWAWIFVANIFLGIHQGLSWSAAVVMKIDIAGSKDRGLAMGLNEFAGYASVGLAAYFATVLAKSYGLAFYPFIPGFFFVAVGLLLTLVWVNDTHAFVQAEAAHSSQAIFHDLWQQVSYRHHNLGSVSINGFVNNLNDAVIWLLLPGLIMGKGFSITQMGFAAAVYPLVWGGLQLITGRAGDQFCKKQLITGGMFLQAAALVLLAVVNQYALVLLALIFLGAGTALVYPNFMTVIADNTHPNQRANALSLFRFWRDMGYVVGALLTGWLMPLTSISGLIFITALITAAAGFIAHWRMCCTRKLFWRDRVCASDLAPFA
ncbi:MAG: MFS transporter [Chitinophagaceae bacterium]